MFIGQQSWLSTGNLNWQCIISLLYSMVSIPILSSHYQIYHPIYHLVSPFPLHKTCCFFFHFRTALTMILTLQFLAEPAPILTMLTTNRCLTAPLMMRGGETVTKTASDNVYLMSPCRPGDHWETLWRNKELCYVLCCVMLFKVWFWLCIVISTNNCLLYRDVNQYMIMMILTSITIV